MPLSFGTAIYKGIDVNRDSENAKMKASGFLRRRSRSAAHFLFPQRGTYV
jgi:hypothetical protein